MSPVWAGDTDLVVAEELGVAVRRRQHQRASYNDSAAAVVEPSWSGHADLRLSSTPDLHP